MIFKDGWKQLNVVLLCFLPPLVLAAPMDILKKQIAEQEYSQAYIQSQSMLDESIGEVDFDYLLGIAAFKTEHFQEAVFSFERVVTLSPTHNSARTYLAFSYFKVHNYDAAQNELTKLLLQPEESINRQQIIEYMDQIKQIKDNQQSKQNNQFLLSASYGYDSNINSGTDFERITLPVVGEIELFASSRKTSDQFRAFHFNYRYQHKLTQKSAIDVSLDLKTQSHNKARYLDRTLPTLNLSYRTELDSTPYHISTYFQPMELDNELYRVAYGVQFGGQWTIWNDWQWQLGGAIAEADNKQSDRLDLKQYQLNTRLIPSGEHLQFLDFSYAIDEANHQDGKHNGKDSLTAGYGYIFSLADKHSLTFNLSYQTSEYDSSHPTFLITRKDEQFKAGLNYRYQLDKSWILNLSSGYTNKHSNIELYKFDKTDAKLTLTYVQ